VTDDEIRERACKALADEAERLQTQVNEFIGRATMARVDLPAARYDANAERLLVPARLRDAGAFRRSPGVAAAPQQRWERTHSMTTEAPGPMKSPQFCAPPLGGSKWR
jgi:hypothetical protein